MRKVYRPRLDRGLFVITAGIAFVAFGLCGLSGSGLSSFPLFGTAVLLGVFVGILGGLGVLSTRVVIDDE